MFCNLPCLQKKHSERRLLQCCRIRNIKDGLTNVLHKKKLSALVKQLTKNLVKTQLTELFKETPPTRIVNESIVNTFRCFDYVFPINTQISRWIKPDFFLLGKLIKTHVHCRKCHRTPFFKYENHGRTNRNTIVTLGRLTEIRL